MMKPFRLHLLALLLGYFLTDPCHADWTVEGVQIRDSISVDGTRLVLNGAGYRKRAYGKYNVQALYLEERRRTVQGVIQIGGVKRISIVALRDITNQTAAKYFIGDLEQSMSDFERKSLFNEVSMLGGVFVNLHRIMKGDSITIDWLPGKGIFSAINGKPMPFPNGSNFLNSEAIFNVLLRVYIGSTLPEELQRNMLGESVSMLEAIN